MSTALTKDIVLFEIQEAVSQAAFVDKTLFQYHTQLSTFEWILRDEDKELHEKAKRACEDLRKAHRIFHDVLVGVIALRDQIVPKEQEV